MEKGTINISDEIQLYKIPEHIVFPDELNRYLKDQIEYLIHENAMLKKNLDENEKSLNISSSTIQSLTTKVKEFENISSKHQYSSAANIASVKIVELSKKLREKTAELESLKYKNGILEKKMFDMQTAELNEQTSEDPKVVAETSTPENEDQLKKLQDKLNSTSMKLREIQNANIQLKNELKMANKYLQQEVGDNAETISNISNSTGWRGRAQIICDLQQKNQELKEKLRVYQGKSAVETSKKLEKKIDTSSKENEELRNLLSEQKKKVEVLRARCKVLETEQTINKSRISSLIAQEERDQNLLRTLTNQVGTQQDFTNEAMKQKDRCIKSLQQDNEALKIELSKQKIAVENLTKDLNDKIDEIKELMRNKRKSPRALSCYGQKNKNMMDDRFVNRLEVERSRLLELTELQASRIITEREAHAKTQNILRLERQKAAKLETNVARLELEITSSRSSGGSYSALSNNKPSDGKYYDIKSELELAQENIKALKTRLGIEQHERKVDLKEFFKIIQVSKDNE